jgi:hypothetical protein
MEKNYFRAEAAPLYLERINKDGRSLR